MEFIAKVFTVIQWTLATGVALILMGLFWVLVGWVLMKFSQKYYVCKFDEDDSHKEVRG